MTRDEAFKSCLDYFHGDELAANVTVDKYLLRDENGEYLEKDLADIFDRNIREILRIEERYSDNKLNEYELKELFNGHYAILQGSPLYGLGNPYARTTLSNCYVVESPQDSMSGIMNSAKELANLFKSRGGCGINLSTLRPEGAKVANSARISTGAWSFASLFSDVTKAVGQCIAEDQLVLTKRGLVRIQDVTTQDFVWTKDGWVSVVKTYKNGIKDIYELTDKNGYSIKTSIDHKFISLDDNRNMIEAPLKELKTGDKIVLIPGTDAKEKGPRDLGLLRGEDYTIEIKTQSGYKNYVKDNQNAAFVLGCLLGFSHLHPIKLSEDGFFEMYFLVSRKAVAAVVSEFLRKNFDVEVIMYQTGNKLFIRVDDPGFISFVKELGFVREDNEHNLPHIPDVFMTGRRVIQAAFVCGFIETHRMFYPRGCLFNAYLFPNEKLAKDFMQILMSFGVVLVNLRFKSGFWRATLPSGSMWTRMLKFFNFTDFKPITAHKRLKKEILELSKNPIQRDGVTTPFKNPNSSQKFMSVNKFESDDLVKPCLNAMVLSEVASVHFVGQKETYDLELESEHLFYCNGYYVHNSGRRGALMEALHIKHPDAAKFITCKANKTAVTSANISVLLSDEFMNAVKNNESEFVQQWPVDSSNPTFTKVSNPKDLWTVFIKSNIASAEPGALFWDRMTSFTPNASYDRFKPICVNPCAEVGMAANSNCRLMSINLLSFVINPYTEDSIFDFEKFRKFVKRCVFVLDDLVDLDLEKMIELSNTQEKDVQELWEKFIDQTIRGREIGLGTHGLADCLAALGIIYGSEQSREYLEVIYHDYCFSAYEASRELAETRKPFAAYNAELERDNKFFEGRPELMGPRRNISLLTSAPTGSISILHQVSSGIEPIYKRSYVRRRKVDKEKSVFTSEDGQFFEENIVYHHAVSKCMDVLNDKANEYINKYFVESHDIDPLEKIKMMAVIQKYNDHSISQTLNLPKGVSFDVVSNTYMLAWELGLKGLTVYVDGSREGILVSHDKPEPQETLKERPASLPCDIHHTTINGEKWIVFVGLHEKKPYEIFCGLQEYIELSPKIKNGVITRTKTKKSERGIYDLVVFGGQPNQIIIQDIVNTFKNEEHMILGRMISLALRTSGKLAYITEQLQKDDGSDFMSYNRVLSRILKKYIKDGEKPESGKCSECGGALVYQEGCPVCMNCGFTKCG